MLNDATLLRQAALVGGDWIAVGADANAVHDPACSAITTFGLGREGSRYGIEEFVEIKYLCFGGIS
jgi:acyl-CoA reductase-like NAD-dependent aldehyde dehydrogenase